MAIAVVEAVKTEAATTVVVNINTAAAVTVMTLLENQATRKVTNP